MRAFYLLLSAFLLFSCKPKTVNYVITGKLVNGCDDSPLKDVRVQAIQMNTNDGFNVSATSDDYGDFELLIAASEKTNYRFMNLQEEVPLEAVDYGHIPLYSNSEIHYRISISNPHTAADTLWIADIARPGKFLRMKGPFHDTLIGNIPVTCVNTLAYNARTKRINPTNTTNTVTAWYKINNVSYAATRSVSVEAGICNTVPDTLTLVVY